MTHSRFRGVVAGSTALLVSVIAFTGLSARKSWSQGALGGASTYVVNDTHFHLTNYIQEGTNVHDFLKIMGNKVGRVALFGIPLQQQWS